MKPSSALTVLFLVATVHGNSTDCKTWPSTLKPLSECCNTPNRLDLSAEKLCCDKCDSLSFEEKKDCAMSCYINTTGILVNGKINKDAVVEILVQNKVDPYYGRTLADVKEIKAAVDKCDYAFNDTIAQRLLEYHGCIHETLSQDCLDLKRYGDCEPTVEHFEKCKNINQDCTKWPEVWPAGTFLPMYCCKTPKLYSDSTFEKLRTACSREFYPHKIFECVYNNSVEASMMKDDSKVSTDVLKKMLLHDPLLLNEWTKPIETAVETCGKAIKGEIFELISISCIMKILFCLQELESQQIKDVSVFLSGCLIESLSNNCVEFIEDRDCNALKRYMKTCLNTKPSRETTIEYLSNVFYF